MVMDIALVNFGFTMPTHTLQLLFDLIRLEKIFLKQNWPQFHFVTVKATTLKQQI